MDNVTLFPFVSVIMPVRNEAPFIRHSLGAVLAQDYPPHRFEILVVDGDSDDATVATIRAYAGDDSRVVMLSNPGRLQAHALNLALDRARGSVIVRVDGRSLVAPDYMRQCVHALHDTGAATVGGPLRSVGITPQGRAIAVAYRSPFGVPSRYRISHRAEYVDQVYLGAWPRVVLDRAGGFDPEVVPNEDYELNYRIRKAGGRVFLTPAIRSLYYGRQTVGALWRQYMQYGRGKLRVVAKYPASTRPRHLVAPAFVAAVVLGSLLALFSPLIAWGWLAVVCSYFLVNLAASFRESRRVRACSMLRLSLAFAVMHVGWGVGFWLELLALLWRRATGWR